MLKVFTLLPLLIVACCTTPRQNHLLTTENSRELSTTVTCGHDTLYIQDTTFQKVSKIISGENRISYALGVTYADEIRSSGIALNTQLIAQGFLDRINKDSLLVSHNEAMKLTQKFNLYRDSLTQLEYTKEHPIDSNTLSPNAQFFHDNSLQEGVVTLDNGMQYTILRKGAGSKPSQNSKVTCHYRGTTIAGKQFESTYSIDTPMTFPIAGTIEGWKRALLMMRTGAKWRLFIPPHLAYGDSGAGSTIPPNSILIYDLELLSIEKEL